MKLTTPRQIKYPESDGTPMAETDVHRDWMVLHIQRLQARYRGRRVYVSGNLLLYFEEGHPELCVAPDLFVVLNCSPKRRRVFLTWLEGKTPHFVLETTSKKTKRKDQGPKKELYARLGVEEYFLYDPLGEWLKPALQGFRLVDGAYETITPEPDGSLVSKVLGLRLVLEDGELAIFDVLTGKRILSDGERAGALERERDEALKQRDAEAAARKKLEEELARLRGKRRNGAS